MKLVTGEQIILARAKLNANLKYYTCKINDGLDLGTSLLWQIFQKIPQSGHFEFFFFFFFARYNVSSKIIVY